MAGRTTRLLTSAAEIAADYDVWLCDVWGVIHNGAAAFPHAHPALSAFRNHGGTVILVTNAPRPNAAVVQQLSRLGVPRNAYDAIVTSGDVTRQLIRERANRPFYHLGPERDLSVFEGTGARLQPAEVAETIVCTGLFDDTRETADDYRDLFGNFRQRDVPMICANPDLVVERGGHIIPCAGTLAAAYRDLGGTVAYAGKPYLPIYEIAQANAQKIRGTTIDRSRLLAIGDGVATDMAGAFAFGIDSLFIPSPIHVGADHQFNQSMIDTLFPASDRPVAAIARLFW